MKKEAFKVFNDEALGRIFMPDGLSYEEYPAECISPFHGRAVALKIAEHQWISVKGGGWNYGGPHIYSSKKDAELIFGQSENRRGLRLLSSCAVLQKIL